MKTPPRRIVAISVTASAAVLALAFSACSVTINDQPTGDGGPDATADADAETPTCTGVEPVCVKKYCDDVRRPGVDYSPICTAAGWACREGQMPMSECRCGVPPRPSCLFPDGGADADASLGDPDAAQGDGSADATID